MDRRRLGLCIILITLSPSFAPAENADEKRIGKKPSEWEVSDWINSQPLTLKQLTGKVVLIRWWTAPDCPYCAATAPALNEFEENYRDEEFVIIGLYHHKASAPLDPAEVKRHAEELGFKFPVAIDRNWKTLRRWWLKDRDRAWTSVSFLLDRQGVIRHIHPGGKYVRGDKAYRTLKAKIEELLKEE